MAVIIRNKTKPAQPKEPFFATDSFSPALTATAPVETPALRAVALSTQVDSNAPDAREMEKLARVASEMNDTLARLEQNGRDVAHLRQAANVFLSSDPLRYQMPQDPKFRPFSPLSTDNLRMVARHNDVPARCISHLISEVVKVPIKVAPRDAKDTAKSTLRAIDDATAWLGEDGGLGGFGVRRSVFEAQMIRDVLEIGALALHFDFATRGDRLDGKPSQVRAIDAATIQPLVTPYGFPVGEDNYAFTQWVQGIQIGSFARDEMIYEGLPSFARSDSPYFMSPTEFAAVQIYTLTRVDEWNRTWLTEGSGYRRWLKLNDNVTPDQATEWMEIMKLQTEGNSKQRHGMGIAPGDITGDESRRDQDFEGFERSRMDRIYSCYGVNPASVGQHSRQYKDSQEAAMDSTREGMVAELLLMREQLYNRIFRRRGWGFLEVTEDVPPLTETQQERVIRQTGEIAGGIKTVNEVRTDNGDEHVEGGDELLLPGTLKPLSQIVAPPAPDVAPDAAPSGGTNADGGAMPGDDAPNTGVNTGVNTGANSGKSPEDKTERAEVALPVERAQHEHEFSCVMAYLSEDGADIVRNYARATIDESDLVEQGKKGDGWEYEPHITVRYGLHTHDVSEIAGALEQRPGITAYPGAVSSFDSSETGKPYDVVKIDVRPDGELLAAHDELGALPHTDSHADYKPHITLAYVQPGAGAKYTTKTAPIDGPLVFTSVRFSDRDGQAHSINLRDGHVKAVARALAQWERKSLNRLERGQSAACAFGSDVLTDEFCETLRARLEGVHDKDGVRAVMRMAGRAKTTSDTHNNAGSFASFWGGSERDNTTKKYFNGKNLSIERNNADEVDQRVKKLFGKSLSDTDFKHLAGAPDGSYITITPHHDPKRGDAVIVEVQHDNITPWGEDKRGAVFTLESGSEPGKPNIYYDGLSTQGVRGFGARMMGYTIQKARDLGMGYITCHAAGNSESKDLQGWKMWPKVGFDALLPERVKGELMKSSLPEDARNSQYINELQKTKEGQKFWMREGESFDGIFELEPKSFFGKRSEEIKNACFEHFGIKLK